MTRVHIICSGGEQAVLTVPAGATEAEIEQEAKECGFQFADIRFHRCSGRLGLGRRIPGADKWHRNTYRAGNPYRARGRRQELSPAGVYAIATHAYLPRLQVPLWSIYNDRDRTSQKGANGNDFTARLQGKRLDFTVFLAIACASASAGRHPFCNLWRVYFLANQGAFLPA